MYAEFVACYEASGQVTWLKKFVPGLKVVDSIEKPLKLYCDNEPAVFCAHNNKSSGAAKHIDIKFYVGMEPGSNYLSRTCQNKQDISGSAYKRPTTQSVQRTLSRHGFKGKPMIPGQRGP